MMKGERPRPPRTKLRQRVIDIENARYDRRGGVTGPKRSESVPGIAAVIPLRPFKGKTLGEVGQMPGGVVHLKLLRKVPGGIRDGTFRRQLAAYLKHMNVLAGARAAHPPYEAMPRPAYKPPGRGAP
jgi:hypothetical protein